MILGKTGLKFLSLATLIFFITLLKGPFNAEKKKKLSQNHYYYHYHFPTEELILNCINVCITHCTSVWRVHQTFWFRFCLYPKYGLENPKILYIFWISVKFEDTLTLSVLSIHPFVQKINPPQAGKR